MRTNDLQEQFKALQVRSGLCFQAARLPPVTRLPRLQKMEGYGVVDVERTGELGPWSQAQTNAWNDWPDDNLPLSVQQLGLLFNRRDLLDTG